MSDRHAATVSRCDSRTDLGTCPCCGYSAAGEPFGACPFYGYSTTAGSLFSAVFSCRAFALGSSRLLNIFPLVFPNCDAF